MHKLDIKIFDQISEDLELTEEEEALFEEIIEGALEEEHYEEEDPLWDFVLEKLEQSGKVKYAVLDYFEQNPLPKGDVNIH